MLKTTPLQKSLLSLLVCLVAIAGLALAFVPSQGGQRQRRLGRCRVPLFARPGEEYFPKAEIFNVELEDHKPLGCRVEESIGHPDEKWVFVSKVTAGGFAEKAGLQEGDVLMGVSGVFGKVEAVVGQGVEKVRKLVLGRSEDEPLRFLVARGTTVLEEHENKLVDLCSALDGDDKALEDSIANFISASDDSMKAVIRSNNNMIDSDDDDDDDDEDVTSENMLDEMYSLWQEELPETIQPKGEEEEEEAPKKSKPRPWSSRSSPSGTFVRDPRTGKMRNIDA